MLFDKEAFDRGREWARSQPTEKLAGIKKRLVASASGDPWIAGVIAACEEHEALERDADET